MADSNPAPASDGPGQLFRLPLDRPPARTHASVTEHESKVTIDDSAWKRGWSRYIFPSFWLFYLFQTLAGVAKHSHGGARYIGYCIVIAFAITYIASLPAGWSGHNRRFWTLFASACALAIAAAPFAHQDAGACCTYLAVLAVASDHRRFASIFVATMALTVAVVPPMVTNWHATLDFSDAGTVLLVAIAMWGFFSIVRSNIALSEARAEVARLAAENERSRIARDLHDLLGHSLTTITVKAGLARRLAERDPDRATIEIAEVEALTRRALTEVRAAVAGYREVSLISELASAREVLRAAGITASISSATDTVTPDNLELFGWVTREGVTNVVRHSRAQQCCVTFGANWIEIVDNGHGSASVLAGNGLTGLRERVRAAGGTVSCGKPSTHPGFRLRVELAADGENQS